MRRRIDMARARPPPARLQNWAKPFALTPDFSQTGEIRQSEILIELRIEPHLTLKGETALMQALQQADGGVQLLGLTKPRWR